MWTLRIARQMITRAIVAKVPFSFVAADSGAGSILSPAPPPRSRRAFPRSHGAACRPAEGPKVRAGTTGPISNWPISKSVNTTMTLPGNGRGVF